MSVQLTNEDKQQWRVEDRSDAVTIRSPRFRMRIEKRGFRYSFEDGEGRPLAGAHPVSGLRLSTPNGSALHDVESTTVSAVTAEEVRLQIVSTAGTRAEVRITLADGDRATRAASGSPSSDAGGVRLAVVPAPPARYVIEARTAALAPAPAYGLGDYGSHIDEVESEDAPAQGKLDIPARDGAEVTGLVRRDMVNQGTNMRFVSTFAVFPSLGFAQVLFEEGGKRVAITQHDNALGASGVQALDGLYYFVGTMPGIYAAYKQAREREGYRDKQPRYEMFKVGWEAYGSLGWGAYQAAVEEALTQYAERGYELAWGVVGSGYWRGDRKRPEQGTTTSFGLWDDAREEGRTDGLPNPRFPDPDGLKRFFRARGIKLLLGIRNHFKAEAADGGHHHVPYNGPFLHEAQARDYLLRGRDGEPVAITNAEFPKGTLYVLDGGNPEAVRWYLDQAATWGADGFKEDAMVYTKHYADGNWNAINEGWMDEGRLVIVRNTAYAVPGDVLRINDTYYGLGEGYHFDQDRVPINLLNYAASGAANLYPDITGGTPKTDPLLPSYRRYFVRNAMFNALMPAMSLGRRPWEMQHPESERIVKKAADWHNRHAPYIYSAVLDSHRTGYPHAVTPLHIAYADDPATYGLINRHTRQYEWMLGPSLLATPVFGNDFDTAMSRDVYLPAGRWIDYETGEHFAGPVTLIDYPLPPDKVPVFVGGPGVIVCREGGDAVLVAEVYPVAARGAVYVFTHPDGVAVSTVRIDHDDWTAEDLAVYEVTAEHENTAARGDTTEPEDTGEHEGLGDHEDTAEPMGTAARIAAHTRDARTGAYRFTLEPGRHYRLAPEGRR
ncbi:hypothetical protein IDH44_20565 [Paenibacillus sp. IB182496]|uniref:Glycosyl hydrolase family 31 C-terminal domain-containing protein n=1 Tax=Paenibacillus sabuli TaxID=2772509 RepID=A0A927GTY8_9BACL|nr:TIM-barrel domain-containing protein [Paenibacillus sabuli]MBD2847590.1 hypothetical protein [Paenibacillus sabuli]